MLHPINLECNIQLIIQLMYSTNLLKVSMNPKYDVWIFYFCLKCTKTLNLKFSIYKFVWIVRKYSLVNRILSDCWVGAWWRRGLHVPKRAVSLCSRHGGVSIRTHERLGRPRRNSKGCSQHLQRTQPLHEPRFVRRCHGSCLQVKGNIEIHVIK